MVKSTDLKEPEKCDYLYIDEQNHVHLMLPLVGGDEIGLDNTCQTAAELRTFFYGKAGKPSAEQTLQAYLTQLEKDILALQEEQERHLSSFAYQKIINQKKQRFIQIQNYLQLIRAIKRDFDIDGKIRELNTQTYPELPTGIIKVLKAARNAFAIRLSPDKPDPLTRFDHPVFQINRNQYSDYELQRVQGLGQSLRTTFAPTYTYRQAHPTFAPAYTYRQAHPQVIINQRSPKEKLIGVVLARVGAKIVTGEDTTHEKINFNELKQMVEEELRKIDSNLSLEKTTDGSTLDLEYVENILCYDESVSLKEWITGVIDLGVSETFWDQQSESVFYDGLERITTVEQADQLSIKVQFLLGEINAYCKMHQLSDANFGQFFDAEPHTSALATLVKEGLRDGDDIEPLIFAYINRHHRALGLTNPLASEQQKAITQKFTQHYNTIKASPHFDEFLIVDPERPGNIYSHQGRICCHFLDFFAHHTQGFRYSTSIQHILDTFSGYSETLQQTPSNRLNHKNELVKKGLEPIILKETVLNYLDTDPTALVAYLMNKDFSEHPNYSLLTPELCNQICFHPSWASIKSQIIATDKITQVQKNALLSMLSRENIGNALRCNGFWSEHSTKPLIQVELGKIAEGLIQATEAYAAKRQKAWWKGKKHSDRETQCASLVSLANEITESLRTNHSSEEQTLDKILKAIAILDRIDNKISAEKNSYPSQLQSEIRQFREQLKQLCAITNLEFQANDVHDALSLYQEHQLGQIRNETIRSLVSTLPAHCQTDDAIAFFNTLSPQEAIKVANYLQLEYRELDSSVNKDQLFNHDIPEAFKRVNLDYLTSQKEKGFLSDEQYETFSKIASRVRPELFSEKTLPLWSCYLGSGIGETALSCLDLIHADEFSLIHMEGLNTLIELELSPEEFAVNSIDINLLGREKLNEKSTCINTLLKEAQPTILTEEKHHALKLAATLNEDGTPTYIRLVMEGKTDASMTFTTSPPLSQHDLQRCLDCNPTAAIRSVEAVDLDYLNQLLTIRQQCLLLPSQPWFASSNHTKLLRLMTETLIDNPIHLSQIPNHAQEFAEQCIKQALPHYDKEKERLLKLNEAWWQHGHLKKLANLDSQLFNDELIEFLNHHDPEEITEATIQGLNFYALSGQTEQIEWDIPALNANASNYSLMAARLALVQNSSLKEVPQFLLDLSPAFFHEHNLPFIKQLASPLCIMEQVPYLNRFIENNPRLTQTHIDQMNQFAEKFPGKGIPGTSSTLTMAVAILCIPGIATTPHVHPAPTRDEAPKVEPVDKKQLIRLHLKDLESELDKLLRPSSGSGNSIINRLIYYATPHWNRWRTTREQKFSDYTAQYHEIMEKMNQNMERLQTSLADVDSSFTEAEQKEIRNAINELKERLSTAVIHPLQVRGTKTLEAILAEGQKKLDKLDSMYASLDDEAPHPTMLTMRS
ncbi:hypothetical protein [Legionella nagasakiensis]|uniref:hypothetical protein n=1 Tax=Legionella nagasakiensis TaxID=535290 RepID=UPI0010543E80|nr:hypothetical protein [Legionella nagasakiensis]